MRFRRARAGAIACLFLLAGCASASTSTGRALEAVGPVLDGPHGFDPDGVHIGHEYGFALPGFVNRSTAVVRILRVFVNFVPRHVVVTHYGVLSLHDSDDYYLIDSAIGSGRDTDYSTFHDYGFADFRIGPGKQSDRYPIVEVRVTGRVSKDLSGCTVDYLEGTARREQEFPCVFSLDGN